MDAYELGWQFGKLAANRGSHQRKGNESWSDWQTRIRPSKAGWKRMADYYKKTIGRSALSKEQMVAAEDGYRDGFMTSDY
jgi:hypothetical protein